MDREHRIALILAEWQECRDAGDEQRAERLLREHPELKEHIAVAEALGGELGAPPPLPESTPREIAEYRIVREIGRGGMGVVYEAEQRRMERRVALKVLSLAITGTPQAIKRFQREAKAAGRLHHTNIVPVYDLDRHDGYWYYAMELVQGRALSEVVAELQGLEGRPTEESLACFAGAAARAAREASTASEELRGTGTAHRAYFIRLAEMFAGVADALELAHQLGVVHRDVKPSNLLLDADGILKIVDFGLARFDDESLSMTLTGELLGTPTYMSPEQALAKRILVDHRTDIYSLGATLYEVLTLRPPFEARSLQELCSQIITKDPVLPRRRNRRIPRDLETIVLKAMEKDRDKRYQTARAFARDLRVFAEGGAIHARRIGVAGRAWRRIKRHRVRSALVASLLVALAASAYLGLRAASEAERRRTLDYARLCVEAERAVIVSLSSTDTCADAGPSPAMLFGEAIALAPGRWEAYLGRALTPGRSLAERLEDVGAAHERGLPARTWHATRAHFLESCGRTEEARRERERAIECPDETPFDAYFEAHRLAGCSQWAEARQALTRVLSEPDTPPALRFLALHLRATARAREGEHALAIEDLVRMQALGDTSVSLQAVIASQWKRVGDEATAERRLEEAIAQAAETGTDRDWIDLCRTMHANEDYAWMERVSRRAIEAHASSELLNERADALRHLQRHDEALAVCQRALDLDPNNADAYDNRAAILGSMKRAPEALAALDRALELDPDNGKYLSNRGILLRSLGRYEDALAAHDRAVELMPNSARVHRNRVATLRDLGRHQEALESAERALEIEPRGPAGHLNRGNALLDLGRADEALAEYDRAIDLDPGYADAHMNRGIALAKLGRLDEALAAVDRAIDLDPKSADARYGRALTVASLGRLNEALAEYDRAIDMDPCMVRAHVNRGTVLASLGRLDEALAAFECAVEINPRDRSAQINLGAALARLGRLEESLAAFDRAIDIDPGHDAAHYNRGLTLVSLRRFELALRAFDRAIEIHPNDAAAHYCRGVALASLRRIEEALAAFERAIDLDPNDAKAHFNRGTALRNLGRIEESLAAHERAVELGHRDPAFMNQLAWYRATSADPELRNATRAVDLASQAVKLAPDRGRFWNTLGVALCRAERWSEAVAALEKSMELGSGGDAFDWFFLAVALQRLKHAERAREWYEKAAKWTAEHSPDDEELKRFRVEAADVLGIATD